MDKRQALRIIYDCAATYRVNLEGKNILFVFGNEREPLIFEAAFPAQNFQHLTGVQTPRLSSAAFYRDCLDRRLSPARFSFAGNGTTPLKLSVLPTIMRIATSARMVGDYDGSQAYLYTERLVGGTSASIGFVADSNYPGSGLYVPNTALKGDIRDIARKPVKRMLAILVKAATLTTYSDVSYLAKGVTCDKLSRMEPLESKLASSAELTTRFSSQTATRLA
jgi:hypothetical protein